MEHNKSVVDPIFIVGLPRSGSTLWSNIISQDPNVLRFGEMHYLNPWHPDFRTFLREQTEDLTRDDNVHSMVDKLFTERQWRGLRGNYWEQIREINPDLIRERIRQGVLGSNRTLGDIFNVLVKESAEIRGYNRCLIKFPVYPIYLDKLRSWYPNAKIVHIIRDPRATALSKTNDPGGTGKRIKKYPWAAYPIKQGMKLFVAVQYLWTSRIHSSFKDDNNYALFKYEDLVMEPEAVINDLCEFLGLEYTDKMLDPKEGQPSSITGQQRRGIDPSSALRWKSKMSPWEARLLEWITQSGMRRFGYDARNHSIFRE